MRTDTRIKRALALRDKSLEQISPPLQLDRLPHPLPRNVRDIPALILEKEEMGIISLDADEILAAIRDKRYSCVAVARAFLRAAALAQVLVWVSMICKRIATF